MKHYSIRERCNFTGYTQEGVKNNTVLWQEMPLDQDCLKLTERKLTIIFYKHGEQKISQNWVNLEVDGLQWQKAMSGLIPVSEEPESEAQLNWNFKDRMHFLNKSLFCHTLKAEGNTFPHISQFATKLVGQSTKQIRQA